MLPQTQNKSVKGTFWAVLAFYMLVAFEFFYMASPFAMYFYSVYAPGLNFMNDNPTLAWLSSFFLPHIVVETSSVLVNLHNTVGGALAVGGFLAFCIGAAQVYYHKLARKGAVTGGVYNTIRHPQYVSFATCSFGLLLLWPRFIVLLMFIAVFFAYYFLAKAEERECEEKFGQSYVAYKNKTNMFLPFRVPLADKLPGLPAGGLKRLAAIPVLYVVVAVTAVGLALGVRDLALNSLYAAYRPNAAFVSLSKIEPTVLDQAIAIAQADANVQARLAQAQEQANARFINYVLPTDWYASEIPMQPVPGARGHGAPANYDKNLYKIVFTRVDLRGDPNAQGKDLLLNVVKRTPVMEVRVDLARKQVVSIDNSPAHINYANIPVAVY